MRNLPRLILILLSFICLPYYGFPQVPCSDFVFNRWYHDMYHSNGASDIVLSSDGNFVVAGFQLEFYDTLRCWIAKFDMQGNMLWQNDINKHVGSSFGQSVEQMNDGSFIVAGGGISYQGGDTSTHGYLAKFSSDGNLLWERFYDDIASYQESFSEVTVGAGYLLAAGTREEPPITHQDSDLWIVRFDLDGNVIWEKIFGDLNSDIGLNLQPAPNGDFWVNNRHYFNDNNTSGNNWGAGNDVWLLRFNEDGELQQKVVAGGDSTDRFHTLKRTSDGGLIGAGFSNSSDLSVPALGASDLWVVKFDNAGNIEWQRLYGGSDGETAYDIDEIPGTGGYYVLGSSLSGDGDICHNFGYGDYWVLQLDANGNLIWEESFGGSERENPTGIVALTDDEFIASGTSTSEDGHVGISPNTSRYPTWIIRVRNLHYDTLNLGTRDTFVCLGTSVNLYIDSLDCISRINWSTGDETAQIRIDSQGVYWAEIHAGSCSTKDSLRVHYIPCNGEPCVIFPNAFTPNGDDINDFFRPLVYCGDMVMQKVWIYNRWGQLIFNNTDPGKIAWDGTLGNDEPASSDVYVWRCVFQNVIDGKMVSGTMQGEIALIR
ncbi:MAG TPA: gliding motility-associated C-terminal domain-containing protein [Saprospiraceae bacterium]|nr:gliding motility-associated C-terminal domain-containing protein [Saprospiraceae bacterium]